MRFSLHLADVIECGDDLIGDGINLAARIQSAADPGAIELSGTKRDAFRAGAAKLALQLRAPGSAEI